MDELSVVIGCDSSAIPARCSSKFAVLPSDRAEFIRPTNLCARESLRQRGEIGGDHRLHPSAVRGGRVTGGGPDPRKLGHRAAGAGNSFGAQSTQLTSPRLVAQDRLGAQAAELGATLQKLEFDEHARCDDVSAEPVGPEQLHARRQRSARGK